MVKGAHIQKSSYHLLLSPPGENLVTWVEEIPNPWKSFPVSDKLK